jgi:hypothetical protein
MTDVPRIRLAVSAIVRIGPDRCQRSRFRAGRLPSENSERGVAQFGVVEESPGLVRRIFEDGHGAEALKVLRRHVGAHRSWVGDDRAEKGDIANVALWVGVVLNCGGLDHDGPE